MHDNILTHIRPGMTVYDRAGGAVGNVKAVHTGAGEFTAEWNMAEDDEQHASFQEVRDLLPDEGLSPTMRERLLQNGFVRLGSGVQPDRFVTPEQIEEVEGTRIKLSVTQADIASF